MQTVGFLTFDGLSEGLRLLLGLLSFVLMLEHVIDELVHALFALKSAALDALEALGVRLLPEHLLFIGQHLRYSSFIDYREDNLSSYNIISSHLSSCRAAEDSNSSFYPFCVCQFYKMDAGIYNSSTL